MRWLDAHAICLCLSAVCTAGPRDREVPGCTSRIAVNAVIPLLPETLSSFFAARRDNLVRRMADTPSYAPLQGSTGIDQCDHVVFMDMAALTPDGSAGRTPTSRLPLDERQALRVYGEHGIEEGGRLPWVLVERTHRLVKAFADRDHGAILLETGHVLHLAVDASTPANTTASEVAPRPASPTGSPRRCVALCEPVCPILCDRLAFEVRVWPDRRQVVSDPLDHVFAALYASHACLEEWKHLSAACGDSQSGRAADHATLEMAANLAEARMEAGVLLGAELIGFAWTRAGGPTLVPATVPSGPDSLPKPAIVVGSRSSKVFHRPACRHALRIHEANRVEFRSIPDARNDGRSPCKTCKP